jgi:hypothetical protein
MYAGLNPTPEYGAGFAEKAKYLASEMYGRGRASSAARNAYVMGTLKKDSPGLATIPAAIEQSLSSNSAALTSAWSQPPVPDHDDVDSYLTSPSGSNLAQQQQQQQAYPSSSLFTGQTAASSIQFSQPKLQQQPQLQRYSPAAPAGNRYSVVPRTAPVLHAAPQPSSRLGMQFMRSEAQESTTESDIGYVDATKWRPPPEPTGVEMFVNPLHASRRSEFGVVQLNTPDFAERAV